MQIYVLTIGLILNDEELQNLTLLEVEKILQTNQHTLKDFRPIPYLNGYVLEQLGNRLICDERNYDVDELKTKFANMFASLTGCYMKFPYLKCMYMLVAIMFFSIILHSLLYTYNCLYH